MRLVEASAWSEGNWVVRKGLAEGDQVIVDNLMKVRPGAAVQPHPPGATPGTAPGVKPDSSAPQNKPATPTPKKDG